MEPCILLPSVHKNIQISLIISESYKWSKNLAGEPPKQWLGVWNNSRPCRHTLQFRRLYHGLGGSVANTSPLEYQKSLQCWKTITISPNAIYPFYIENIEFLIKVSDVKKPLYRINWLLVIIYGSHVVKWQPHCKHLNILIFILNQIRILKIQYISFFPKIYFWLSAATLRQGVVVQYSPWWPSWKMAATLKTT